MPKGLAHIEPLLERIELHQSVPALAKTMFALHKASYIHVQILLREIEAQLKCLYRQDELCKRLGEIPAIGPVGAVMLASKVSDATAFKSGRDFSAWLGLTPRDHSTAGKYRLGGITRAGDEALRSTLVQGATALIQHVRRGNQRNISPWLLHLLARKPPKLVAVALANKTARIAWKLIISGERYDAGRAVLFAKAAKAA